jgi:hypothetical protein
LIGWHVPEGFAKGVVKLELATHVLAAEPGAGAKTRLRKKRTGGWREDPAEEEKGASCSKQPILQAAFML